MDKNDRYDVLGRILEDYHRRKALGEKVHPEDYRREAGPRYEEMCELLRAEEALDEALFPTEEAALPRTFGDYTLLSELGRGAAGVVYEAVHRGLGRKVALKILKTGFDTEPSVVKRFRREARACAQVRHDHVVEIYEAGVREGRHYYAMALIAGRSLARLARDGALPGPRALAEGLAGVADALHVLHENGIVHRDVKPGNVMVEPSGRMVLADFGLARTAASEALTRTGESLGTPLYMSPEQLLGDQHEIDGRTDVYGFGATMYEVLAGRPVFTADDIQGLMRMILKERPEPLRTHAPGVPDPLERIVLKTLEKRSADRYENAGALRDDLRAFARGDAVAGRPVSAWRRASRAARRHAPWAGPLAAGLLALAGWLAFRPPDPAVLGIRAVPTAAVSIDGRPRGVTPLSFDLPPGEYRLEITRDGFEGRFRALRLGEGQQQEVEVLLRPIDPGDPATLNALAAAFDVQMDEWEGVARSRGAADSAVEVIFPRGPVRRIDVDDYRFRLAGDFRGEGRLVFRVDGEDVWPRRLDLDWPELSDTAEPLPAAVLEALGPGSRATWGYLPDRGDPVLATFELVDADTATRLTAVESGLAGLDRATREQIAAGALLDAGLPLAAWRRARAVAEGGARFPAAWAVMKQALKEMELEGTEPWRELLRITAPR